MLYDPVKRHQAIEKLVTRAGSEGQEKRYYRFRPARWYGGIVTADCAGCGLMCRFCWVSNEVMLHPNSVGRFYTAGQVADRLVALARKCGLNQLRISGGEPTIGKAHLLEVLDLVRSKGFSFILETNGIPVACDEGYARDLSKYGFVHVRVSLKGCSEKEFAALTGAKPEGFALQLESLRNLVEEGVSCHASVMVSFSKKKSLQMLTQKLRQIGPNLAEAEVEELILYPHVVNRIQKYGLEYGSAHKPDKVPKEQV